MLDAQTLITLAITVLASLLVGVTGFGFGLAATPLYATVMPIGEAVALVSIASLPLMVQNAVSVRSSVMWRDIWPLLLTSLPASALGTYMLATLDTSALRILLAAATLLGCIVALWSPKRGLISRAFPWAYFAGLVGGFIGGAVASGGPPIVLYCLLRGWDKSRTKGLLSVYFTFTGIWRVIQLAVNGLLPWPVVRLGLALIIPAVLFCYFGTLVFQRISTQVFRYATVALLVVMAVTLIIR